MATSRQLLQLSCTQTPTPTFPPSTHCTPSTSALMFFRDGPSSKFLQRALHCKTTHATITPRASPDAGGIVPADVGGDDGVSLGTMKLPPNIDIPRFETLLFQWANSLSQGANLPLPVPLKVDKVEGGARLGFIEVDDGKTQVCVYIDCLVFPATGSSGPYFQATRNGPQKEKAAPGEPRIMRSLLQALQKSAEIARV